jgi:hypothetical protein
MYTPTKSDSPQIDRMINFFDDRASILVPSEIAVIEKARELTAVSAAVLASYQGAVLIGSPSETQAALDTGPHLGGGTSIGGINKDDELKHTYLGTMRVSNIGD